MLVIHQPLEVPRVDQFPEPAAQGDDASMQFLPDYVLTQALKGAVVIEAEQLLGERHPTPWLLRSRNSWGPRTVIAQTQARWFRSILAAFNGRYLEGQLYGGNVRRVLSQGEVRRTMVIHTGNEQASGFWIRITSGQSTDR